EYTHWINNWGGAIFSDAGDAADTVEAFRARVGWGGGLRWRSPVGPLALDFARGRSQPSTLVHFSIAVAF
ncbi:MAG: BamA/TamA family outer membrane protein, partial [Sideroxydans sp.]